MLPSVALPFVSAAGEHRERRIAGESRVLSGEVAEDEDRPAGVTQDPVEAAPAKTHHRPQTFTAGLERFHLNPSR